MDLHLVTKKSIAFGSGRLLARLKIGRKSMEYELLGGGVISGSNNKELCEALWHSAHFPEATLAKYMDSTAAACKMQNGAIISTYNCDEFIADLLFNGFLIEKR